MNFIAFCSSVLLILLTLSKQVHGDSGEVIIMESSFNDRNITATYNLGMKRIINVISELNKTAVQKNLTEWMNLTAEDFGSYDVSTSTNM